MLRKKIYICLILFGVLLNDLSSQNNSLSGLSLLSPFPSPYGLDIVDNNNLTLHWYSMNAENSEWDLSKDYTYCINNHQKNSFININGTIPEDLEKSFYPESNNISWGNEIQFLCAKFKNPRKHFLKGEFYYPSIFIGYTKSLNNSNSHTFLLTFPDYEATARTYKNCTSFLKEYGKEYKIENLNNLEESTPWVEGAEGYGIGESFIIENLWGDTYKYLLIMNGYISVERPYLYCQNGRVKQIRVEGVESGIYNC